MSKEQSIALSHEGNKGRQTFSSILWNGLIASLLAGGLVCVSFYHGGLSYANILPVITTVFFCFLVSAFLEMKSFGSYVFPAAGAICIAVILVGLTGFLQGFLQTVNECIELWNYTYDDCIGGFLVTGGTDGQRLLFWVILGLLSALFLLMCLEQGLLTAITLYVLVLTVFSVALHVTGNGLVPTLLFLGWLLSLLKSATGEKNMTGNALPVLLALLILAGAALLSGGSQTTLLSGARQAAGEAIEEWRYGTDTLPQGDLTKEGKLLSSDDERLIVTTENPESMYLKGYVGSTYTGTGWDTLKKINYTGDNQGILDWLLEEGLTVQTQYTGFFEQTDADAVEQSSQQVNVENVGANRKYIYMPYTAIGLAESSGEYQMDWQVTATGLKGAKDYQFTYLAGQPSTEQIEIEDQLNGTYADAESVYQGFALMEYTEIDDDMADLMEEVFDFDSEEDAGLYPLISRIRAVLNEKEIYMEEPDKEAYSEDKIRQFLTENHTGNSMSFASAAVMAFRSQGYAARYVEGYFISENEAEENAYQTSDGKSQLTLTSKNAHAWVEVYVDQLGWMPVEVTPGYYEQAAGGRKIVTIPVGQKGDSMQENVPIPAQNKKEEPEKEESKEIYSLPERVEGSLLIILYIVFFFYLVLELQRFLRRRKRATRFNQEDGGAAMMAHFHYIELLLGLVGILNTVEDPAGAAENLMERLPSLREHSYVKAITLMGKVLYGEQTLNAAEERNVRIFTQNLEDAVRRHERNIFTKLYHRYRYAV